MLLSHLTELSWRIEIGHNFFQSIDICQSPLYILYIYCYHVNVRHIRLRVLNMHKTWNGCPRTKEYGSFPVLICSVRIVLYLSCTCPLLLRYISVLILKLCGEWISTEHVKNVYLHPLRVSVPVLYMSCVSLLLILSICLMSCISPLNILLMSGQDPVHMRFILYMFVQERENVLNSLPDWPSHHRKIVFGPVPVLYLSVSSIRCDSSISL